MSSANVVNYVLSSMNEGSDDRVAFFFLQHDNSDSLKAETFLRSVIRQTIVDVNTLSENMEIQLRSLHRQPFVSLRDWSRLLQNSAKDWGTFFIFIDGLDEYDTTERRDVLDVLSSLAEADPGPRIFITSRDSVWSDLKGRFEHMDHVSMACDSHSSDIRIYVEATIDDRVRHKELVCGNPDLLDEIKNALSQHADGMQVTSLQPRERNVLTAPGSCGLHS